MKPCIMLLFLFSIMTYSKEISFVLEKDSGEFKLHSASSQLLLRFNASNTDSLSLKTMNKIYADTSSELSNAQNDNNELYISITAILSAALLGAVVTLYQTRSQRKTTLHQIRVQNSHSNKINDLHQLRQHIVEFYQASDDYNIANEIVLVNLMDHEQQKQRHDVIRAFNSRFYKLGFFLRLYPNTKDIRNKMNEIALVLKNSVEKRLSTNSDYQVKSSEFMELAIRLCNKEMSNIDDLIKC